MREALAIAMQGLTGLGESPTHDASPVDRLHAIAAAQRPETYRECRDARGRSLMVVLGRDLIAVLDGDGERWRSRCEIALAEIMQWRQYNLRLKEETARYVARQAMHEAKESRCHVCHGKTDENGIFSIPDVDKLQGRTPDGPVPMRPCPACDGTGKHRFSDVEREQIIGDAVRFTRAMTVAHGIISQSMYEAMQSYRHLFR